MILFTMDLTAPRKDKVVDFMDKVENNVKNITRVVTSHPNIYLSNLPLEQLQKHTDIPLIEVTLEEIV